MALRCRPPELFFAPGCTSPLSPPAPVTPTIHDAVMAVVYTYQKASGSFQSSRTLFANSRKFQEFLALKSDTTPLGIVILLRHLSLCTFVTPLGCDAF